MVSQKSLLIIIQHQRSLSFFFIISEKNLCLLSLLPRGNPQTAEKRKEGRYSKYNQLIPTQFSKEFQTRKILSGTYTCLPERYTNPGDAVPEPSILKNDNRLCVAASYREDYLELILFHRLKVQPRSSSTASSKDFA